MLDYRKNLPEVSTKQNSNTSKWLVSIEEVTQSAIHRLHHMMMLRACFIPDDERCLLKELMIEIILLDIAGTLFMAGNGDLEA